MFKFAVQSRRLKTNTRESVMLFVNLLKEIMKSYITHYMYNYTLYTTVCTKARKSWSFEFVRIFNFFLQQVVIIR